MVGPGFVPSRAAIAPVGDSAAPPALPISPQLTKGEPITPPAPLAARDFAGRWSTRDPSRIYPIGPLRGPPAAAATWRRRAVSRLAGVSNASLGCANVSGSRVPPVATAPGLAQPIQGSWRRAVLVNRWGCLGCRGERLSCVTARALFAKLLLLYRLVVFVPRWSATRALSDPAGIGHH